MKKVLISIAAHESEVVIVDQCRNYVVVGDVDYIIVHINGKSAVDLSLLIKLISDDEILNGRVWVNTFRVTVDQHSKMKNVVTNLYRAHLANYFFANNLGLDFDYFCLDASNTLLIRPGLKKWISSEDTNGYHLSQLRDEWIWTSSVNNDLALHEVTKFVRASQHEGTFYKKSDFEVIANKVFEYEMALQKAIGRDLGYAEYPREEILFPSFCNAAVKIRQPYIYMPWSKKLTWTYDEVSEIVKNDCVGLEAFHFGIKRVERVIDDPIRVYLSSHFKYISAKK